MEIKQLRMFRTVVEAGSISEAARRMNLSQPPLSYHMKMLEQELQATLFLRGRKKIELTEAGKLLYERSQTLLDLESAVSREVTEAGVKKTLRVGVTPTTAPVLIPALAAISQTDENLRFEVFDGTTFPLREMLEKRLLDCTLLRSPIRLDGFDIHSLGAEPFIAVGKPERFHAEQGITLRQLTEYPLILYRRYESFLHAAFHEQGLSAAVRSVCDDARTALLMAQSDMGIALLPRSILPLAQNVGIRTVAETDLNTEILFVCRKENRANPLICQLIERMKQDQLSARL